MSNIQDNSNYQLKEIAEILDVPIWESTKQLPSIKSFHSPYILKYEQELGFLCNQLNYNNSFEIFISNRTDIKIFFKILPFFFTDYQIYACESKLIYEKLYTLSQEQGDEYDNAVTVLLNSILEKSIQSNSSDIHIETMADKIRVRIRINGLLEEMNLPDNLQTSLILKIKLLASMDIAQRRLAQDGHFQFESKQKEKYDLRISSIPTLHGEKIVIRILPTSPINLSLENFQLNSHYLNMIKKALQNKLGLILLTGPTGSGKTTTLYGMLKELNSTQLNIVTVEDPIEYQIDGITQVQVNPKAGTTFSSILRSFLRQDPDVILVGEIRDQETAQIVSRAAQTGHLVFSTLHSHNVFEALNRLHNLGVNGDELASSLKMIISQRLMPQKCTCNNLNKNCPDCHGTGIKGRIPVAEILNISAKIRKLLNKNAGLHQIQEQAFNEGFQSLYDYGKELVKQNLIEEKSLKEINFEN